MEIEVAKNQKLLRFTSFLFLWPKEMECSALIPTLYSCSYVVQERVKKLFFLEFLLNASFREKMENKIVRRSRISEIKCNLMKRRCTSIELSKSYRKLILPEKSQRVFQNCILGLSLVYGVFVENAITISCPGGCSSTLCSDRVIEIMKSFGVRNVVVMAGTNNLFDKRNKPLMGPFETSDEMYYLIEKLKFCKFKVTITARLRHKRQLENH